jgi:FixJ family two-component response regulator
VAPEPTVFVVDDDRGVRDSLRALFESAGLVVETHESAESFLASCDPGRAGCLILDLRLRGGASGLELQQAILSRDISLPVIVLTAHGRVADSVRALKAGALDFLQKPVEPAQLLERTREALRIDAERREAARRRASVRARMQRLTPREREIVGLLMSDATSKEIGRELAISTRTVEAHRRAILLKMEATSSTQLVRLIASAGLGEDT